MIMMCHTYTFNNALGQMVFHNDGICLFEVGKILMVLKEASYAYQGCIYLIKNTLKAVVLWNIITI